MALLEQPGRIEIIHRDECLRLLATEEVGRVAVVSGGVAHVVPVNYVLDGDAVVFKTGSGTKLYGATRAPVTFEADHIDRQQRGGWSVVLRGLAQEITTFDRVDVRERLWALALEPWADGDRSHLIRIPAETLTGRRLIPADPA